ncbi:efflux RND transporter permease subunit [Carboxylicivirga sp. N1Y90]|uniref:efflux RND transporter permease subunit n=1 Tax=Carboxylicivirga fragile TaxID=3417571 RepID=UPI003D34C502|nr:efflux RND transporter permease subunit [Marinilabiliaceae bacterium N1Y90]
MKQLISYFIKFPLAVNMVMVMALLLGLLSLNGIQKNFFPNIGQRFIYVDVLYPGASPDEIEEGATLKIEENVKGLEGLERITSISRENSGSVSIEMLKGTDMDEALIKVKNEVEKIASFPTGIESVVTYKHDDINFAMNFVLTARDGKSVDLRTLKATARKMEHDLLRLDGISKIEIGGYPDEEIAILLKENAMEAYQMTFREIAQAVSSSNLIMTGGSIKDGSEEFFIRVRNKAYQSEGIEDIVIRQTNNGGIIRLKDVATISDRWADTPSEVRFNNQKAVVITISNTFSEDILKSTEAVKAYLKEYNASQDYLEAEVIRDMSKTLNQRIDLLLNNGLLGILLVLLFLSLFLNPRIAFWVAAGIPFSLLGMFIFLPGTPVTINMLSLFGLILVLGILVDDAIVVAENVYRHWQLGKNPIKAAVDGTLEVMPAVLSGILTTMLAFSTFIFLDGKMGDMFKEVSIVVILILFVSLIEGLIILPAHMAHSKALTKNSGSKWKKYMAWAERGLLKFRDVIFKPLLEKAIHNKIVTSLIFTGLFILSIVMLNTGVVRSTFFPEVEGDDFTIALTMPSGTDESVTQQQVDKITDTIWSINDEMRSSQPNNADIIDQTFQQFMGSGSAATIQVTLLDAEIRDTPTSAVITRIREKVGDIPGAEGLEYIAFNPFGKAIVISLLGDDNDVLQQAKEELKRSLQNMPELSDVTDNAPIGNREIEIELKAKAHHLDVSVQDVISQVREAFFGNEVQRLQRGKDEVKVWVKYSDDNRKSIGQLETMKIRLSNGVAYPLSELATLKTVNGVANIRHLNFDREVQLEANQSDPSSSLPVILNKIETEILSDLYEKYPGVKASYDGQKRESDKMMKSATKAMPIILLLMFAIVIFTLRSVSQSILIYLMIPLSLVGVVIGHWIHGMSFSLMSGMGIIALVGVMINDGLVLINAFNINLKEGMPLHKALFEAGMSRFRPIILTTLTTVAGMAPMLLETSMQAKFLIPMAISLCYGMAMATTTTLFLLPALLLTVNGIKVKFNSMLKGRKVSQEEVETAIKEMKYNYEDN